MSSVPNDRLASVLTAPSLFRGRTASAVSRHDRATYRLSALTALMVAVAYLLTARLHESLALESADPAAWWGSGAFLLAALVLGKRQHWWIYMAVMLLACLFAPLFEHRLHLSQALIQYVITVGTALIGAVALQSIAPQAWRFDRLPSTIALMLIGGALVPFAASALSVFSQPQATSPWSAVAARTLLDGLETVTLFPLIGRALGRTSAPRARHLSARAVEATTLFAALCAAAWATLTISPQSLGFEALWLCALLPLLIWATLRFGSVGTALGLLLLGLLPGPSAAAMLPIVVLSGVPLLLLATSLSEREALHAAGGLREATFHAFFQRNITPTVAWNAQGQITDANGAFLQLTGFTRSDLESGRVRITQLAPREDSETAERELALRDGRRIRAQVTVCRFPDSDQGVAFVRDLSAERSADAARRHAESLHSAVLTTIHDRVVVLSGTGTVVESNESWRVASASSTITALQRVRIGQSFIEACIDAARSGDLGAGDLLDAIRSVLAGLSPHRRLELCARSFDTAQWFEVSVESLRCPQGGVVINWADISERKQATLQAREQRQQLVHLGRAAVLGELSGAFAHELNQPLTSILGNAEAALQLLSHGSVDLRELSDILSDIIHDDVRAADVLQRLRSMLTRGEIPRQFIDLNQIVHDVLALARSDLIGRSVTVTLRLEAPLAPILADRVQMQQVILNLVVNACEAMDRIPTGQRQLTVLTRCSETDHSIQCSIADQGHGLAPSNIERIFQPFVTTKRQGLGLGLAICRSIVEAHGGRMWAENLPSSGAVFHFTVGAGV